MTSINYIVKVTDAKAIAIQKALEQANIQVKSIIEVFKEEAPEELRVKS